MSATGKAKRKDASAGARDEAALLAEIRRGGGSYRQVVLTRNRRVMASIAQRGKTLRLHESFAAAPPEVLHALTRLFSAKSVSTRAAARQVVNGFLAERSPAPTPVRRQPREIRPEDRPHLERLRAEFECVNQQHFGGLLPAVPLYLSGRMHTRLGHFSRNPVEIVISRRLCEDADEKDVMHTLQHEMIHLWQHVVGQQPDHGLTFRFWARLLRVRPRAKHAVTWRR